SLNASAIKAGKISVARLDVAAIFAQTVSATNLTITQNSKIGVIGIDEEGRLRNRAGTGGLEFSNADNPTGGYRGIIAGAPLANNTVVSIENNASSSTATALMLGATTGIALNIQRGGLIIGGAYHTDGIVTRTT